MAEMTTGKFEADLLRQYSELTRIYEQALRAILEVGHTELAWHAHKIAREALGE